MKEQKTSYIYGKNPVIEALKQDSIKLQKVILCFGVDNNSIKILAKKNKIPCVTYDKKKFQELERKEFQPQSKTQGVIALKEIIPYLDFTDFLNNKVDISNNPIVAILDGITDPHNFGAIARSAECAGVTAIILPENNSTQITPVTMKTSAGALNYIPTIKVTNLIKCIEQLKEKGFWIVGTSLTTNKSYTSPIYNSPVAIIIGSEGKGMSPSLMKHCDYLVKIEMKGQLNSLNASVSAGIMFFEILRQRKNKN